MYSVQENGTPISALHVHVTIVRLGVKPGVWRQGWQTPYTITITITFFTTIT
jgi:hypothetical protein